MIAITAHEGPPLDVVGPYTIVDCQQCQFAHVIPLPDEATLQAFYADTYYQEEKPDYFRNADKDRGWWELVYAERLAEMEHWLGASNDGRGQRLLDVGSGPGLFLMVARRRGWQGVGVELSPHATAYSRQRYQVEVYDRAFDDDCAAGIGVFDAVNLGEVLEHVPDPAATLRRVHQVLLPGGVVCAIVPNDFSILQGAAEQQGLGRWWLQPPAHLNYFNVRSLHGLFRRCGFSVADVTCTFPLEVFLLMGLNYVGNETVGRQIHGLRKRFEIGCEATGLGEAKRELYRAFAKRGIGRDIVMMGKKL